MCTASRGHRDSGVSGVTQPLSHGDDGHLSKRRPDPSMRVDEFVQRCIGCGCLSLKHCKLLNPGDQVAQRGPRPRSVLDDE